MLTVVTGWSPAGWAQYGRRMAATFVRYWPADVDFIVYVEERVALPRGRCRMLQEVPGWPEFLDRWRGDPAANGRIGRSYSFKFDAVKFARQAFIAHDAAVRLGAGRLAWFDGDTFTKAAVPEGLVEGLLDAADVAYLGRVKPCYPEIGFVAYRLPEAMPLLECWHGLYASGDYRELPEWHSGYVWEAARRETGVMARDLTPRGMRHVFPSSPLGAYVEHLKGERRKQQGAYGP